MTDKLIPPAVYEIFFTGDICAKGFYFPCPMMSKFFIFPGCNTGALVSWKLTKEMNIPPRLSSMTGGDHFLVKRPLLCSVPAPVWLSSTFTLNTLIRLISDKKGVWDRWRRPHPRGPFCSICPWITVYYRYQAEHLRCIERVQNTWVVCACAYKCFIKRSLVWLSCWVSAAFLPINYV